MGRSTVARAGSRAAKLSRHLTTSEGLGAGRLRLPGGNAAFSGRI